MDIARRKSIHGPGLASGPAGALRISLAAQRPCELPGHRIEPHDMIGGAIRPDIVFHHLVGIHHRLLPESGITGFIGGPVEQIDVHHAVNNGPSRRVLIRRAAPLIPCPDDPGRRIEAAGKDGGCHQAAFSRLRISRDPVIGHRRRKPYKAHIVMQSIEIGKCLIQLFFRIPGDIHIPLLPGTQIEKPHDSRPEAVGPPGNAIIPAKLPVLVNLVVMSSRYRRIRDFKSGFF